MIVLLEAGHNALDREKEHEPNSSELQRGIGLCLQSFTVCSPASHLDLIR